MMIQVQWDPEHAHTFSGQAVADAAPGVVVLAAIKASDVALGRVTPQRAKTASLDGMARARAWLYARPTAGVTKGGLSKSFTFRYRKGRAARVDVVNLVGHNLRQVR